MYIEIKRLIKAFIPKRALFKYEPKLRFVFYLFYKGEAFQCNICNKKLRRFIFLDDGDKLCPYCGSLSRTRRLYGIIAGTFLKDGLRILDFSPSRSLYRVLKNNPAVNYAGTDLSGDFLSDFQYNITDIDAENDKYDLIICYHILEHIDDDNRGIQELYRVLKNAGTCIIQTPFKEGGIYEDSSIKKEEEKLKHFGQKDHVRVYSVDGLRDRLVNAGFRVSINRYTETEDNKFGFKTKEEVLICTK
jgi:SAM-dependent methyltransferase